MARSLIGKVTSAKSDKTIVLTVTERKTHPLYKKQYTVNTKFMAHDEKNESKPGDLVMVTECRPISARKHFRLEKILQRAAAGFEEADAVADIPAEEVPVVAAPKPVVKDAEPAEEAEPVEEDAKKPSRSKK